MAIHMTASLKTSSYGAFGLKCDTKGMGEVDSWEGVCLDTSMGHCNLILIISNFTKKNATKLGLLYENS